MDSPNNNGKNQATTPPNHQIRVYARVRPVNARDKGIRSSEVIEVHPPGEIVANNITDPNKTKTFTFDRTFGSDSKQTCVYHTVVAPLIEEVMAGLNCTVFVYGQTGTGKTHTMVGTQCAEIEFLENDESEAGIIPRALSHIFHELRKMELEATINISYLEVYNEELCDLLASEDSTKIRMYDDSSKKGSVIIQGLEEIRVESKNEAYKLLEKGKERRRTAPTLMNAQSSRSHTVFSVLVHIKENGIDGEEMLKIGKLNLVDLAGSENVSKAGNKKGIHTRETVNINQSLLTLGRVMSALVERAPHIPYRESKLTRLLQESLGGRAKTSIIATVSPGHKDLGETLSTLEYAHRAKNIQNRPEVNQKLIKKTMLNVYTDKIGKLERDLMAAREKNGIYLAEETYNDIQYKLASQKRELNEKVLLLKAMRAEMASKERLFNEVSLNLIEKNEVLIKKENDLRKTQDELEITKMVLSNTKRRYLKNKVILENHVKSEKILLHQASKLTEVAYIATNDTVQLHNTIDCRRDVDVRIQSVCEQFTNRMKDSFEMMDENLYKLKRDHTSVTGIIKKKIDNSIKLRNKFVAEAMEKIELVCKAYTESLESLTGCVAKHLQALSSTSVKYNIALTEMFTELWSKESELKTNLEQKLGAIRIFFEEHNSSLEKANQEITARITENQASLSSHTDNLKQRLAAIAAESKTSFDAEIDQLTWNSIERRYLARRRQNALAEFVMQEEFFEEQNSSLEKTNQEITARIIEIQASLSSQNHNLKQRLAAIVAKSKISFDAEIAQLIGNTNARRDLAMRRQNALAEFEKQMQQMEKEERTLTNAITRISVNLELNKKLAQRYLTAEQTTADEFCGILHKALVDLQKDCDSFNAETKVIVEKVKTVFADLVFQHNETHKDILERRKRAQQAISNNTQIQQVVKTFEEDLEEIQEKSVAGLSECQVIQTLIKSENTRLTEQDIRHLTLTTSLRNNVWDYGTIYKAQMKHCVEDLNRFRTNELQTYAPTGLTPSKREFSYPRVLASTSSHNHIVKRLRQESDWSDVEVTINEDSETAAHISDPAVILNSTPIDLNPIEKPKEINGKNREGTYMASLKQMNSRKPPFHKISPVVTAYNKENKENFM